MQQALNKKSNIVLVIFLCVIIFPLLGENVIGTVLGDSISKVLSIFSCIILFIIILKNKKIRINSFLIIMVIIILLKLMTTFVFAPKLGISVNNVNNMIVPYGMIAYFTLFLFIEQYKNNKEKMILIFKSMTIILTLCVFMNFFFTSDLKLANNIEVFKEAMSTGYTMSRIWLFGHRNMIFIHHLMWIVITYIYYKLANKDYKKMFFWQSLFTLLVSIVSWNSTMMVTTALIFVLGIQKNKIISKININHYIFIYLFLELGIVFFRIQDIFAFLIVNILHRNLSFTGRTDIWDYYITQFKDGSALNLLFGNFGYTTYGVNTHNMFLGLLAFSGIIGLTLYFLLVFLASRRLRKEANTESSKFVSLIIFGFLINSLTMEFYLQPLIALYIGYLIKDINLLCNEKGENNK